MKKILLLLAIILLASCGDSYQYPDIGKSIKIEIYSNFELLEHQRGGLSIHTNGYEQIVVIAKERLLFDNYYFKASASNRVGSAFIYKLPITEMNANDKIIFEIPKFSIDLLEDKETEVIYQIISDNEIIEQFKYIVK